MRCVIRKPVFSGGGPTRFDTNGAVQTQMVRGMQFGIKEVEGLHYLCSEKTKTLISCMVTMQLICGFVFAYAKSWFSHEGAQFHFMIIALKGCG